VSAKRPQRDGAERSETDAERSGAVVPDRSAIEAPSLTIINNDATPEEIAAIVAVFSAMQSAEPPNEPTSTWAARHRRVRPPLRPGPGAWRASGLPR
jgi:hypothetical protein